MIRKKSAHLYAYILCSFVFIFLPYGFGEAASFDCSQARTSIEIAICSNPELSEADSILNTTYRRALANNPAAKERQLAWLNNIRNRCQDHDCILQAYRQQTSALRVNFIDPYTSARPDVRDSYSSNAAVIAQPKPSKSVSKDTKPNGLKDQRTDAKNSSQHDKDSAATFWFGVAVVFFVSLYLWNKFLRRRCIDCKSTKVRMISVDEVDRWRGNKKVTESNTRGTTTRYISTTYVKKLYGYQCQECAGTWFSEKKEEL